MCFQVKEYKHFQSLNNQLFFLVPKTMHYGQYCTAVVDGVVYVINDWPAITKLGSCGFEMVKNIPAPWGGGRPLCSPTSDNTKLLFCIGKECGTYDPSTMDQQETGVIEQIASLTDYHTEGKMILNPQSNEINVIGGTHNWDNEHRAERLTADGNWEWIKMHEGEILPNNYRFFSTATGPGDFGTFTFSGFALDDSSNIAFQEPYRFHTFQPDMGTADKIDPSHILYPISDIGMEQIFEPKNFDSIGGNGYVLHHRTQDCTNGTMRFLTGTS